MNSLTDGSVMIQTSADSLPCPPPWWGELVLLSQHLRRQGILIQLTEGIRFEQRRFGGYELVDFLVILAGLRHQWGAHPTEILRGAAALGTADHWRSLGGTGCHPARPSRALWRP